MINFLNKLTTNRSIFISFLILYGTALFTYILLRSYYLSFTFDEVVTSSIVNSPDWFKMPEGSNNHYINTLLMKLSVSMFGESEFTLRLPNSLSFILYFIYSVKIANLNNKPIALATLVLLTSMPFVIDFFSLARGYGLSLAFMLPSIYYFLLYFKNTAILALVFSVLFGMLGVLSNFTLFNYFLPLILSLLFFTLFLSQAKKKKIYAISIIMALIIPFIVVILPLLFKLKEGGQLYFGGNTNFFYDTIFSLGRCFAYYKINITFSIVIFTSLFILAFIISIFSLIKFVRNKQVNFKTAFSLIVILSVVAPILQSILFKTSFPAERTALMFYPLIIIAISGTVYVFQKQHQLFFNVLSLFFFIFFIVTINTTHCYSWRYDGGTKYAIKELASIINKDEPKTIGVNYIFNPSVNYYRYKYEVLSLNIVEVTKCWEYDLNLEELDPYYYQAGESSKTVLTLEDGERLKSLNLDFYYLDKFIVNELKRLRFNIEIIKSFEYSRSFLIKFNDN